jgi:hypothetical protein
MNITVPTYSKAWKPYTSLLVVKHGNMLWFHQLESFIEIGANQYWYPHILKGFNPFKLCSVNKVHGSENSAAHNLT